MEIIQNNGDVQLEIEMTPIGNSSEREVNPIENREQFSREQNFFGCLENYVSGMFICVCFTQIVKFFYELFF